MAQLQLKAVNFEGIDVDRFWWASGPRLSTEESGDLATETK